MPKKLPKVDTNFTIFVDPSCRSPIEEISTAQLPVVTTMAQVPSPDINPTFEANLDPAAEKQPRVDDHPTPEFKPSIVEKSSRSAMSHDVHDFDPETGHEQFESHPRHQIHSRNSSEDTLEHDDDVFSDNGNRSNSSLGSVDGPREGDTQTSRGKGDRSRRYSFESSHNSDRILSGVSGISRFTQYDKEFVPTYRETRKPFRTPSEIKAMQMSSPTTSTFNGASPRLAKRQAANSTSPFPTVSRVGSPNAQYSPKGRSTPTRLKQKEAPLVLLHVTLLPLRWVWGNVLNGLDAVNGKALDENGLPYIASEQLKTLRDSWRELQNRINDNILERGILLPHPQNDFEVLEERLLEALELPVKRRARILECGHYLGPSSITSDLEDDIDDDSSSTSSLNEDYKKHWCADCKSEIRFEHLGSKKVFRVKVFASNGLMKAGAWDACWNQMERVDIEVEPIVDSTLHSELEKLGAIELEYEEQRQQEATMEAEPEAVPTSKRAFTPDLDPYMDRSKSRQSRTSPIPGFGPFEGPNGIGSRPGTARPATARPASILDARRPMSSHRPQSAFPEHVNSAGVLHPPEILSPSRPRAQSRLHVELIDESEERRLRDEERMREIYGETPPTESTNRDLHAAELDSQALAIIASSRSESGTRPTTAHSPAPEMYEQEDKQRERRRFSTENPSFVDLLTEAFRVALTNSHHTANDLLATIKRFCNDPKNVAIVVLTLLIVVIGLGGRGKQDMAPAVYRPESSAAENPISPPRVPVIESAPEVKIDASVKQSVVSPALGAVELVSPGQQVAPVAYSGTSKPSEAQVVHGSEAQQVLKPATETVLQVSEDLPTSMNVPTASPAGEVDVPGSHSSYCVPPGYYVPAAGAVGVYAEFAGFTCYTGVETNWVELTAVPDVAEGRNEPAVLESAYGEVGSIVQTVPSADTVTNTVGAEPGLDMATASKDVATAPTTVDTAIYDAATV